MVHDDDIAESVIPGSLKRSKSYHADYGKLSYGTIKVLASKSPADRKARQMKKLIEQVERLRGKGKGRRS